MEHIEILSGELWLAKADPLSLYHLDFGITKVRSELAVTKKMQVENKTLNDTMSLTPLSCAKKMKPMIDLFNSNDPRKSMENLSADDEAEKRPVDDKNRSYSLFTR